jgi:hypothetical protein
MNLPPGLRPRSRAALSDVEDARPSSGYRQSSLVMSMPYTNSNQQTTATATQSNGYLSDNNW